VILNFSTYKFVLFTVHWKRDVYQNLDKVHSNTHTQALANSWANQIQLANIRMRFQKPNLVMEGWESRPGLYVW